MRADILDQARAIKEQTGTAASYASTDEQRLTISRLFPAWASGEHIAGDIYTADGQVWECYQAYDNATHPDIVPGAAAWATFNRPLHGRSRTTAREFVQPTGAHDMYHSGEYALFSGKLYLCVQNTAYSPADYAAAWEEVTA